MQILEYDGLTTCDLKRFDPLSVLFVLPVSLFEAHGPHLPLATDVFLAQYMARTLAGSLDDRFEFEQVVLFPALTIGAGGLKRVGTIDCAADNVQNILVDYGRSLAGHKFRYLLVTSGHGGQAHLKAIEQAALILKKRYGFCLIPVVAQLLRDLRTAEVMRSVLARLPGPFSKEQLYFLSKDDHAGWLETSMMLLARPDDVRPLYRELKFSDNAAAGGYQGAPGEAGKQFGQAVREVIVERFLDHLRRYLDSEKAGVV